jgi:hypothetical protein
MLSLDGPETGGRGSVALNVDVERRRSASRSLGPFLFKRPKATSAIFRAAGNPRSYIDLQGSSRVQVAVPFMTVVEVKAELKLLATDRSTQVE